ncbi:Rpn family recombination-promoting nuclease/putative transposase [Ectothiorhodospira shaposhnikovii]|uniref:Rpn family recombination-promoting nuclease/putative transposase n=1 Tax=Ectothiorhodospira shaposhnikovii TaxID=1054 RepID=UPI001EE78975|nr:Rpn family recombination-promoting nuclease/putative transposase [Ectothiorhodospira shaposhnikovii]MCG5514394.1 Rpn family recombination-promoting nuclease/putative transposase [Ectothiorhodospira shaposhnikovii]
MVNHHDTGYKELFSYPELVRQLMEGFAPPEVSAMMDFSTLTDHSGNYITPLFNEKFEDKVWSVEVDWEGVRQRVFVYLLLEFQSTVDHRLPIRMLHYVACFYDHLIKTKVTTARKGMPPIFPVVLYNGSKRWTAREDIYRMVRPEPPMFLRVYQPHLRYYLVNESAFTEDELAKRDTPLSGIFEVEKASKDVEALQGAVKRLAARIRAHPEKARLDEVITRWLKRHLKRLGAEAEQALEEINSLVEDHAMLAENLQTWAEKERQKGRQEGRQEGEEIGLQKGQRLAAMNLLKLGLLTDEQIAQTTGLSLTEVIALRSGQAH